MAANKMSVQAVLNPDYFVVRPNEPKYRTLIKNGRHYNAWKPGKYVFPCDENARDDADILNGAIFQFCYYGKGVDRMSDSPLEAVNMRPLVGGKTLRKALDLGCGSGLWVSHVAAAFPDATIVGVDLTEGQDMYVPNAIWRVPNSPNGGPLDFDEDLSSLGLGSFDYVRMAHLNGSIADERALLRKAFELAVPGTGHVEMTYVDLTFKSANPEPLSPSNPLCRLQEQLELASRMRGIALNLNPPRTGDLLESIGFADRIHRVHMLPLSSWSVDRSLRRLGEQMEAFGSCCHPLPDCECFLSGVCMELLTKWLDKRPEDVVSLVIDCNRYLRRKDNRVYVNLHTFTARRPGEHYNGAGV